MVDVFLVDGQALTPEVFGFYKEGKGYISVGSTQATDFRPGQWVPKAPRTIKSEINRRGGFGVNGFYLPMNDSSNFGADFHTTPNSIITLKGEDLPQPRNGAPTTSDAYVSQLRSDPYAANLVLAVPGISVGTTNLVSNGDFSNGTTGWTISDAAEGSMAVVNGQLVLTNNDTVNPPVYAWQEISTTSGKTYTLQVDIVGGTSSSIAVYVNDSSSFGSTYGSVTNNAGNGTKSHTFVASGTSVFVLCRVNANEAATSIFDNVIIKEELARDYSADIKGSGTNKTLTPNGNAGIEYVVPSYYGSALSFDGTGDYFTIPANTSDLLMGSDDFTIEAWVNKNDTGNGGIFSLWDPGNNTRSYILYTDGSGDLSAIVSPNGTAAGNTALGQSAATNLVANQWHHCALEREGSYLRLYLNGVVVGIATNLSGSLYENTTDTPAIGTWFNSGVVTGDINGYIQDLRVYKGVAKYKGGFDVPKPYTPVGIGTWRAVPDCTANNFATLNPLASRNILSNGNLTATFDNSVAYNATISNFMMKSGKWYCEVRIDEESTGNLIIGVHNLKDMRYIYGGAYPYFFGGQDGSTLDFDFNNGVRNDPTANDGDIIQMKLDLDSSPAVFSVAVNGGSYTDFQSGVNSGYNFLKEGETYGFVASDAQSGVTGIQATFNFGQNPTFSGQTTAGTNTDGNGKGLFKYQPPSGFLALCEDNLPTPAIADPGEHFKTVLYAGDSNDGRNIVGVGFTPDLVWIKSRTNGAQNHGLYDSVRGAGFRLMSNQTTAEGYHTNKLTSFSNDGFVTNSANETNEDGHNFVAWCWKAGGAAVSNTDGSITSQVSANQDAGFSIVSYTGTGSAGTVGHGLGKNPGMIIIKSRDSADAWPVWHKSLSSATDDLLQLEKYVAVTTISNYWNSSAPNTTTFGLAGGSYAHNLSGDRMIAYCWAEIEGFSKFGSYVGNGNADGPFVYCGFKPAWVMVKNADDTGGRDWAIQDSSRASSNPCDKQLKPNQTEVENSGVADSTFQIDMLSNGFKVRNTTGIWNENNDTIIFAAFAESPFKTANSK